MARRGFTTIEKLAVQLAMCAPARRNKWAVSATVPWDLIEELRTSLEAHGIDWRALRRRMLEIERERARKREARK